MAERIPQQTVKHIAKLARIELSQAEIELFSQQLSQVIDYNMTILNAIPTDDIQPTSQVAGLTNIWHDQDQPAASLQQSLATSQARQSQDGQFVVPKVMGEG